METLNAATLSKYIDMAWEAVNNSKAGPVVAGKSPEGHQIINMIAAQTLQSLLQSILPKGTVSVEQNVSVEQSLPREPWQGDDTNGPMDG